MIYLGRGRSSRIGGKTRTRTEILLIANLICRCPRQFQQLRFERTAEKLDLDTADGIRLAPRSTDECRDIAFIVADGRAARALEEFICRATERKLEEVEFLVFSRESQSRVADDLRPVPPHAEVRLFGRFDASGESVAVTSIRPMQQVGLENHARHGL